MKPPPQDRFGVDTSKHALGIRRADAKAVDRTAFLARLAHAAHEPFDDTAVGLWDSGPPLVPVAPGSLLPVATFQPSDTVTMDSVRSGTKTSRWNVPTRPVSTPVPSWSWDDLVKHCRIGEVRTRGRCPGGGQLCSSKRLFTVQGWVGAIRS